MSILPPPIAKVVFLTIDLLKNPRSFLISMRYVKFRDALKLPIKVAHGFKIENHGGRIIFDTPYVAKGMLQLGYSGTGDPTVHPGSWLMLKGSRIIIRGHVFMSRSTHVRCGENATIIIGDQFWCNNHCYFVASPCTKLEFKSQVLIGWNVDINTYDGHDIILNNQKINKPGDITIGQHVWIGSHCIIAKGVEIQNDCVVARNSMVLKSIESSHIIIGGSPARILKNDIQWK